LIGLGCLCLLRKPERTEEDPQGSARAPLPA